MYILMVAVDMLETYSSGNARMTHVTPSDVVKLENDIAASYGYYYSNLASATHPPPAINPRAGVAIGPRMLPWTGRGTASVTVPAGKTIRLSAQPWCTQPLVYKMGEIAPDAPTNAQKSKGSVYSSSQRVGLAPATLSVNAGGDLILNPDRTDPDCFSIPFMGLEMKDSGFGDCQLANDMLGSSGQFCGGYMEIEVILPDNASASAVAIGPDETRDLGRTSLTTRSMMQADIFGIGGLYDFEHSTEAATIGGLSLIKGCDSLVGGSTPTHQYYAIPIPPTRTTPYDINVPGMDSGFLATASKVVTATAATTVADTAANTSHETNLPGGLVGTLPIITTTFGNESSFFPRIWRATNSLGQCLQDGMPQFELTAKTGVVELNIKYKMFYQMIVTVKHPNVEMARLSVHQPTNIGSMFRQYGGYTGSGRSLPTAHEMSSAALHGSGDEHDDILRIPAHPVPSAMTPVRPGTGNQVSLSQDTYRPVHVQGHHGNALSAVAHKLASIPSGIGNAVRTIEGGLAGAASKVFHGLGWAYNHAGTIASAAKLGAAVYSGGTSAIVSNLPAIASVGMDGARMIAESTKRPREQTFRTNTRVEELDDDDDDEDQRQQLQQRRGARSHWQIEAARPDFYSTRS